MKVCNRCKIEKEISDFSVVKSKRNNYLPKIIGTCKKCLCEKSKIYNSKKENKEKRKIYNRKYKKENKESILEYNRNWATNNQTQYKETKKRNYNKIKDTEVYKTKRKEYHKLYRNINKEKLSIYHKDYVSNRKKYDIIFTMREYYKGMISNIFKRIGINRKSISTNKILGCTYEDFKLYLENKFEDWMNWENRGLYNGELNYGWDIDHIIPVSSAKTEEELIKLNHYTNLQPLCSFTNRVIKRDN